MTLAAFGLTFVAAGAAAELSFVLPSPNGRLNVRIQMPTPGSDDAPRWTASFRDKALLRSCRLSLSIAGDGDLLAGAALIRGATRSSNKTIKVLFGRASSARDQYRETRLTLETRRKRRLDVIFRCYNDGIAVRYEIPKQPGMTRVTITEEGTSFGLAGNPRAYVQYLENYLTSHEHEVETTLVEDVKPDTLLDMPATFSWPDGTYAAITEAALRRYAGMSLMHPRESAPGDLVCRLTPRPDGTKVVRTLPVVTPWRVALVGDRPGALLESNTLYALNEPPAIGDISWIKPGKLTFSWWNGNVVRDAKPDPPIFSLEAQKIYIDFCAASGISIHSVIADNTDTPWYKQTQKGVAPGPDTDVTKVRADLDLAAIRDYAKSKGIRLWTWVHHGALRGRVEEAFAAFEKIGWSGMMVDFFDHDDQETVEFSEEILRAAARHHILIHFHGFWKPTGLQRTYPNLMNHEGALNYEYLKWSDRCTPEHTLNLLFTRMVAGPMDYHAGGFRAVPRPAFKARHVAPNVIGTRSHHLATYVCFDNPAPMVADYPEAYTGQPGFEFLTSVPTWWDETRVLQGRIGEVILTARRKGRTWYLAVMSAKEEKDLTVPLSFLGPGRYSAAAWKDAPDADIDPNHLISESFTARSTERLRIHTAPDGGFVARFTPLGK
jgi:alpha-glucosidase